FSPMRRSGTGKSRPSAGSTRSWRLAASSPAPRRPISCSTSRATAERLYQCRSHPAKPQPSLLCRLKHHPEASRVSKTTRTVRKTPIRAAITGVYGYVPPDVLTNAALAEMVDTSDEWITERTGIKERHILKGKGLGTSHMGAEAVRGLLKKTGAAA